MAPATGQFAIYQSAVGVTAVTSPVQRQILEALADGDLQLPEIMELTGKAKSTLSSIHMKELLNRELVQELPHPTDSRRKIYHLIGRPMQSDSKGDAPGGMARSAPLKQPVVTAPTGSPGLPLAAVFQVLATASEAADEAVLEQCRSLGRRYARRLDGTDTARFASSLTRFVEEERLAHHLQLDFESLHFRCRPGAGVEGIPPARMGAMVAAFAEGAAAEHGLTDLSFHVSSDGDAFQLRPDRS